MDTVNELNEISLDCIAELARKKIKAQREKEKTLLVTRSQIIQMCGLKSPSSTLKRWQEDPTFPKPIPRSGIKRWFKSDIINWLRAE